MTPHPHDNTRTRHAPGVVNGRHDPGRYLTLDRNSIPDHPFRDPTAPVNRTSHCIQRGTS